MKNTIADQAGVNKKLNKLYSAWRDEVLPEVIEGWEQMTQKEKEYHLGIINHWCGLHFTVGLSEQSNKSLLLGEELIHNGQKQGSPTLPGGYSTAGVSGAVRLVREVCKAVQERGCNQSGNHKIKHTSGK
jgi:hypothetical protein